jgi:hypothetical protein
MDGADRVCNYGHTFFNESEGPASTFAATTVHNAPPGIFPKNRSEVRLPNSLKRHGRAILTQNDAQDIFKHKPLSSAKERQRAGILARFYGVSVKTVRDIWVGRTWYRATFHLDSSKPIAAERLEKKPGRPLGAKDSKPRTRKWHKYDSDAETKPANENHDAGPINYSQTTEFKSGQHIAAADSLCLDINLQSHQAPLTVDAQAEAHTAGAPACLASTCPWTPSQLPGASDVAPIGQPANPADGPPHAQSESSAWSEAPISELPDPFHDDWAFWPNDGPASSVEPPTPPA